MGVIEKRPARALRERGERKPKAADRRLASSPSASFWYGFLSVVDLFGVGFRARAPTLSRSPSLRDAMALGRDWAAIGEDLRVASRALPNE